MAPFTIAGIERDALTYPTGYASFRWRLSVNSPSGLITFESPGFTQTLRRPPILVARRAFAAGRPWYSRWPLKRRRQLVTAHACAAYAQTGYRQESVVLRFREL